MRFSLSLAIHMVAAFAPVSVTAQTRYEPLAASSDWTMESTDGGPALQEAIAATDWPDTPPLMEGWVSRWVYMRLFDDRQVFFVLVDEDAAEEKYVCRVTFDSFPPVNSNRDADASVARLGALCERENLNTIGASSMLAISPGQPGGPKSGEQLVYSLSDGTQLTMQHVENSGIWLPSLPPEIANHPLVVGYLPTPRQLTSGRHDRFWYIRERSGRWGLSFHFGHGQDLGRSGCFVRNFAKITRPPNATWLNEKALEWCRAKQQAYVDQHPNTANPVVRPPPKAPSPRN